MEKLIKGDVIVIPFPFSNLTQAKRRPALVVASLRGADIILCQITSKDIKDDYAVKLKESDFLEGSLHVESNARPNKLFTADKSIVLYKIGCLKSEKMEEITEKIVSLVRN